PDKGKIDAFAQLIAVEEVTEPFEQIQLEIAQKIKPGSELGDEIEVKVTPKDMGRIAAQTAKQTMMQKLRQAEKEMIFKEFRDRAGDIVSGTVRRFEKSDVMIDLGKFEGVMPSRERVNTEEYNVGDRIRAYVVAVDNGTRGPEIILSRSHPNFVKRLFEFEVSEIADHTVEIRGIAREPGFRTKVAVHSADEKVDPVGACVGLRGARVKNIVRELNNEKVDIIRWSDDVSEFVSDALKPAVIRSIEVGEEDRKIRVTVDEAELSKAIGRRGQNARLTSRLIGWDVQVEKDESAHEIFEQRVLDAAHGLGEKLGIAEEHALALVQGGIHSIEMFTMVDFDDIVEIFGGDEGSAKMVFKMAQRHLGVETDEDPVSSSGGGEEAVEAEESSSETEPLAADAAAETPAEEEPEAKEEEVTQEHEEESTPEPEGTNESGDSVAPPEGEAEPAQP
ncbi:MAG: transcription termination factor NusA, partial [Verrucomicrobiota bacterium]